VALACKLVAAHASIRGWNSSRALDAIRCLKPSAVITSPIASWSCALKRDAVISTHWCFAAGRSLSVARRAGNGARTIQGFSIGFPGSTSTVSADVLPEDIIQMIPSVPKASLQKRADASFRLECSLQCSSTDGSKPSFRFCGSPKLHSFLLDMQAHIACELHSFNLQYSFKQRPKSSQGEIWRREKQLND